MHVQKHLVPLQRLGSLQLLEGVLRQCAHLQQYSKDGPQLIQPRTAFLSFFLDRTEVVAASLLGSPKVAVVCFSMAHGRIPLYCCSAGNMDQKLALAWHSLGPLRF